MRAFVLTLLVAIGLALTAGSAAAGGPTSALLASPGNERAAALYHTDAAYTDLQSILDDGRLVGGVGTEYSGSYVNVTWLIHDIHIWRTDRIDLDAKGGPVVETTMFTHPSADPKAVRRQIDRPMQLTALLNTLRLTGPAPVAAPAPIAEASQRTPLAAVATRDARWEWGIGGLLLGALAAAAIVRVRRIRAER